MISLILLSGGKGTRMGSALPKQYLPLHGKPVALHSLDLFVHHPAIEEVIVVCALPYREIFADYPVRFAEPGKERQDSLYNGLQQLSHACEWVCVHDAARPLVTSEMITTLIAEGKKVGAACLGMPTKWTMKEADREEHVAQTLDRSKIWEIQTPQLVRRDLLEEGFAHAKAHGICVTDDVSIVEEIGHPVKLVRGSYKNIKITTPEDLIIAECLSTS